MLWAFTAAGGMGLLLGLWFRVPALIAISGLVAATYLPVALTELGPASALVRTVTNRHASSGATPPSQAMARRSCVGISMHNPKAGNIPKLKCGQQRRRPWCGICSK